MTVTVFGRHGWRKRKCGSVRTQVLEPNQRTHCYMGSASRKFLIIHYQDNSIIQNTQLLYFLSHVLILFNAIFHFGHSPLSSSLCFNVIQWPAGDSTTPYQSNVFSIAGKYDWVLITMVRIFRLLYKTNLQPVTACLVLALEKGVVTTKMEILEFFLCDRNSHFCSHRLSAENKTTLLYGQSDCMFYILNQQLFIHLNPG